MKLDKPIDSRRLSSVRDKVFEAYRGRSLKEGPRPYLGASIAGHPCTRYLWLNFRWAFFYQLPVDGRIELLFLRGQEEEYRIVNELTAIGLDPLYVLTQQADIDYGGHVKGHPDGLVLKGVPEAPKSPHNLEFKTHKDSSFRDLVSHGVEASKPQHYIQQQLEMYGWKYILKKADVQRSLYYAVNKNDDDIYTERICLDRELAEKYIHRLQNIALEEHLPAPLSSKPDWWQCKMCPFHGFCHNEFCRMLPEVSCRTCAHSTPKADGTWYCEYWKDTIPEHAQRCGCDAHVVHPDLVPDWELDGDRSTDWTAYYKTPHGDVMNGIEGEKTIQIMEAILKEEGRNADYLYERARLEALPDENADIPF